MRDKTRVVFAIWIFCWMFLFMKMIQIATSSGNEYYRFFKEFKIYISCRNGYEYWMFKWKEHFAFYAHNCIISLSYCIYSVLKLHVFFKVWTCICRYKYQMIEGEKQFGPFPLPSVSFLFLRYIGLPHYTSAAEKHIERNLFSPFWIFAQISPMYRNVRIWFSTIMSRGHEQRMYLNDHKWWS